MSNENNVDDMPQGKKYVPFAYTFEDPWEGKEVDLSFRFAKPSMQDIKRLQNTATKDATLASRNLLIAIVHPDDAENLKNTFKDYAGCITTLAGAILKGVGIQADLGK